MLEAYFKIFAIFALMFLGYFLSYRQWFSNQTADTFSKLVLNLALPCSMFLNITANFSASEFIGLFSGMIIPLASMLLTFFISKLYIRLASVKTERQGIFATMFTCSNTIFIGLPINLAIFGEKAIPFVLLYYIVNTTIFWTLGVYQIARDNPVIEQARISFHPLVLLKKIFTPALLGFIVGLFWMFLAWPVPTFVAELGSYLAELTTPLSMFIIGIIIYFGGIKQLRLNRDIVGIMIGRFLISPLVVWLLGQFIQVPELMLQVFIIQAAMPVQNSVTILARNYHADEEFAAASLAYSVLIYLVYLPLLLKFLL